MRNKGRIVKQISDDERGRINDTSMVANSAGRDRGLGDLDCLGDSA